MIDLHSHTNESDGTLAPETLIKLAKTCELEALAITDHDTFAGYDMAYPLARRLGIDLICGIEISTKFRGRSVHLLGYFPKDPPAESFRAWIGSLLASRDDRNARMVERLRSLGLEITLDEVKAKGRSLAGRPHFARVLMEKGYVKSIQQAFDEYLDEGAKGYVDREEAEFGDAARRVTEAGGVPSLAHPVRLRGLDLNEAMGEMCREGLEAIEVYHSDHKPEDVEQYLALADQHGLAITGGSDFHGANKPDIRLGTGIANNLNIPIAVVRKLRTLPR